MTVTTEYLECILEEVVCVANKTKKTCCMCGKQNKTKHVVCVANKTKQNMLCVWQTKQNKIISIGVVYR